jgi:hypothetical protein
MLSCKFNPVGCVEIQLGGYRVLGGGRIFEPGSSQRACSQNLSEISHY